MKASSFLDKLSIVLLGCLLVCLGMLLYNFDELQKIEKEIKTMSLGGRESIDSKLGRMIDKMELESDRRRRAGATKSSSQESARDKN